MSAAGPQRNVAAVSLAVTAVIVVVMAVWGFNALTAPFEDDGAAASASPSDDVPTCGAGQTQRIVKFLATSEVTVSVYNAGKKKGRAGVTLNLLENRGFRAGAIGNAPADTEVLFAEIRAKASDALQARLVQLALGRSAKIVTQDEKDLAGPGVNVVIGDDFKRLKRKPTTRIALPEPVTVCE